MLGAWELLAVVTVVAVIKVVYLNYRLACCNTQYKLCSPTPQKCTRVLSLPLLLIVFSHIFASLLNDDHGVKWLHSTGSLIARINRKFRSRNTIPVAFQAAIGTVLWFPRDVVATKASPPKRACNLEIGIWKPFGFVTGSRVGCTCIRWNSSGSSMLASAVFDIIMQWDHLNQLAVVQQHLQLKLRFVTFLIWDLYQKTSYSKTYNNFNFSVT